MSMKETDAHDKYNHMYDLFVCLCVCVREREREREREMVSQRE